METEPDESSLNVIGGLAPGIGAETWPMYEDEPMTHLFTLDLKTLPDLQKRYPSARTMSVFCHQPDYNEAWTPENDWTEVQFVSDTDIAASTAPPEDVPEMERAYFEVVSVCVPYELKGELRKAVYGAGARIGGEPIWLQEEEHWGDFVMQFDESFVHMNLGDCGIMYVFSDTAFWQCH